MNIADHSFSTEFKAPFIQYGYIDDDQKYIDIDFLVMTFPKKMFRPAVKNNGLGFELGIVCPDFLSDKRRLNLSKADDVTFGKNSNQSTSFATTCNRMWEVHGNPTELIGQPQFIRLLFKCEVQIVQWTVQTYDAGSNKLNKKLGSTQFLSVLSVSLKSVDKPVEGKLKGVMKVLGSPGFNLDATDSEVEKNMEQEYEDVNDECK